MYYSKIPDRRGSTLTELIVAATLLVSSVGIVAQLTVRTGRLWQDVRHHQLALDELSNQLESLTELDEPARQIALADLKLSVPLKAALPNAKLTANTVRDHEGSRIVVTIDWDRPVKSLPLSLVGWLDPMLAEKARAEGGQP